MELLSRLEAMGIKISLTKIGVLMAFKDRTVSSLTANDWCSLANAFGLKSNVHPDVITAVTHFLETKNIDSAADLIQDSQAIVDVIEVLLGRKSAAILSEPPISIGLNEEEFGDIEDVELRYS